MELCNCPKCGEENPAEAVMCWACYTPLGASAPLPASGNESAGAQLKDALADAAPYAAIAGLTASGWLPRAARLPFLGASASVLGVPLLFDAWKRHRGAEKYADEIKNAARNSPTARIAQTMLYYALKDKATATRIEVDNRGMSVSYQIEGEWREQMKIPLYAWKPIRQQLTRYARRGEFDFQLYEGDLHQRVGLKLVEFEAQLEVGEGGETLRFQFESELPDEFHISQGMDIPPDVNCLQCREFNLPDALWCWNCGANLKDQTSSQEQKYSAYNKVFLAGLAALTASGWSPRRARLPVLGAGALSLAALFAFAKWDDGRENREQKRDAAAAERGVISGLEAPAVRVANQILLYAIQRHISTIRVQESGNVVVAYDAGEKRREQFVLPGWVWLATREQLLKRAREGTTCQGKKYAMRAELSSDMSGETLILRFVEAQ